MKISFRCSECGGALAVPAEMAGKRGKCPKCQAVIVVPAAPPPKPRPAAKNDEIEDYDPGNDVEDYEEDDDDELRRLPVRRRTAEPAAMRRCPMCGARNSRSSKSCRECGEELTKRKSNGPSPWGKPLFVGQALQDGWEAFQGSAGPLIGATVLIMVISAVLNFLTEFAGSAIGVVGRDNEFSVGMMAALLMAFQLALALIRGYFALGITNMAINAVRGETEFGDLFIDPVIALKCLIAGCAYYIVPFGMACLMVFYVLKRMIDAMAAGGGEDAVEAAILGVVGEMVPILIVGGIITWTTVFILWPHSYLLLEEKEGILGCLPRAMYMSLPNLHKMLGLWIIVLFVYFGGFLLCCVGMIAAYPLGQCMLASSYVQMCGKSRR